MNTRTIKNSAVEDTTVSITVNGKLINFNYGDLKIFHKGDSWFGCTVGFRAMQLAAREFSRPALSEQASWSRENLSIVSGHPGPGVKDAIELITATVSSNQFELLDNINTRDGSMGCNSNMKFEWWVTAHNETIHIKLHDDIIPDSFLALLDRLNVDNGLTDSEKKKDRKQFDQMKKDLSNILWNQSLDASFDINYVTTSTNGGVSTQC
jgi:hypothetical protein